MSLKHYKPNDMAELRSILNFAHSSPRPFKPSLQYLADAGVIKPGTGLGQDDPSGAWELVWSKLDPRVRVLAYAWAVGSYTSGEASSVLGLACSTIRDFSREWASMGFLVVRRGRSVGRGRGETMYHPNFERLKLNGGKTPFPE